MIMDQYKFLDRAVYFKGTGCQFFESKCRFCVVCQWAVMTYLRILMKFGIVTRLGAKDWKIGRL